MKHNLHIQYFIYISICLLLAACGGGGSSSGSGSDSAAISSWVGTWKVTGSAHQLCPGDRSIAAGDILLSQEEAHIVGTYSIRVICEPTVSDTVKGTLSSTFISNNKLVLVDDEGDIFTFSNESGVMSLNINDPDTGIDLYLVAFRQ